MRAAQAAAFDCISDKRASASTLTHITERSAAPLREIRPSARFTFDAPRAGEPLKSGAFLDGSAERADALIRDCYVYN